MSIQPDPYPLEPMTREYRDALLSRGFRWITVQRRAAPGQFVSMHKRRDLAEKAARADKRLIVDLETEAPA